MDRIPKCNLHAGRLCKRAKPAGGGYDQSFAMTLGP